MENNWEEVDINSEVVSDDKKKSQVANTQLPSQDGSIQSLQQSTETLDSDGQSTSSEVSYYTKQDKVGNKNQVNKEPKSIESLPVVELPPIDNTIQDSIVPEIKPNIPQYDETPRGKINKGLDLTNKQLSDIESLKNQTEDVLLQQEEEKVAYEEALKSYSDNPLMLQATQEAYNKHLALMDDTKATFDELNSEYEKTLNKKDILEAGVRNLGALTEEELTTIDDIVDRSKYIYNKILEGVGSLSAGASDLAIKAISNIPGMIPEGMSKDEAIKKVREDVIPSVKSGMEKVVGADLEEGREKQFDDEFVTSAIGGLASSTPAMLSPYGTGLFLQAYDSGIESINNTDKGSQLPESTKTIYAIATGITQAALEKYGLDKIFKGVGVADKISSRVLLDVLNSGEKGITKEAVEAAIDKTVSGLKNTGEAAATEYLTGSTQELSNVLAEKILNKTEGQEIFEPKSWGEEFGRINKAGLSEATGGFILWGVAQLGKKKKDLQQDIINSKGDLSQLDDYFKAIDAYEQEVDPVKAEEMRTKLTKMVERETRIPASITNTEARSQSSELIEVLDNLREEKEKSDPAYHKAMDESIKAIETDLQEILVTNKPLDKTYDLKVEETKDNRITTEEDKGDSFEENGVKYIKTEVLPLAIEEGVRYTYTPESDYKKEVSERGKEREKILKDFENVKETFRVTDGVEKEAKGLGFHSGTEQAAQEREKIRKAINKSDSPLKVVKTEKLKNPVSVSKDLGFMDYETVKQGLITDGVITREEANKTKALEDVRGLLQSKGYDGIIYRNGVEDRGSVSQIVFPKEDVPPSSKQGEADLGEETPQVSKFEQYDKEFQQAKDDFLKSSSALGSLGNLQSLPEFVKMVKAWAKREGARIEELLSEIVKKWGEAANKITKEELQPVVDEILKKVTTSKEKISQLKPKMRMAKKRKHESEYRNKVKQFASINTRKLDSELFEKYKEAIDDLNQKVPNYKKMEDIYDEVVKADVDLEEYTIEDLIEESDKIVQKLTTAKIDTLDDYLKFLRGVRSLRRKMEMASIFAEDADKDTIDKNLSEINEFLSKKSEEYKEAVKPLKEDLIKSINESYNKRDVSELTKEDLDLLKEYKGLSKEELMTLDPVQLEELEESFNRVEEGYFPYYQINQVVNAAKVEGAADDIIKQIKDKPKPKGFYEKVKEKYKKYLDESKQDIIDNMGERDLSFLEDVLGLEGNAITRRLSAPFSRALSKMKQGIDSKSSKLYEAVDGTWVLNPKKRRRNMTKIGMVMNILRDYHRMQDSETPGRDWYVELINDEAKFKEYKSKSDRDNIKKAYDELKEKYSKDGKLDVEKLVEDFKSNPLNVFDKDQLEYYNKIREVQEELKTKQRAVNEALGKPFEEEEWYMTRYRIGSLVPSDVNSLESYSTSPLKKRATQGKAVTTDEVGAIETDAEKVMLRSIAEVERDYNLFQYDQYANKVLNDVIRKLKGTGFNELLAKSVKEEFNLRSKHEFSRSQLTSFENKLRSAKMASSLSDIPRSVNEIISAIVANPIRTRTFGKGYMAVLSKKDREIANELLKTTNSSLVLRDLQREFGHTGTSTKRKNVIQKAQEKIISLPEHFTFKSIWMPSFRNEFKSITGDEFNDDSFIGSDHYKEKYKKAIDDAAAVADKHTKKVIGAGTKGESRRLVKNLPNIAKKLGIKTNVDANSRFGKALGFFAGYMQRESDVFFGGIDKILSGNIKEGAAESVGVLMTGMIYNALQEFYYEAKKAYMEDDKERIDDLLNEYKEEPTEKTIDNLSNQILNMGTSRYSGAGRNLAFVYANIKYNSTTGEDKKKWETFIREVLYKKPITDKDSATTATLAMISPEWSYAVKEAFDLIFKNRNGSSVIELYNKAQNDDFKPSEEEADKLKLTFLVIDIFNAIGSTTIGVALPGRDALKDYLKKGVDLNKKEEVGGGRLDKPLKGVGDIERPDRPLKGGTNTERPDRPLR